MQLKTLEGYKLPEKFRSPISTVMGSNYFWVDKLQVLFYSLVLMPSLSNDVHCPLLDV